MDYVKYLKAIGTYAIRRILTAYLGIVWKNMKTILEIFVRQYGGQIETAI